MDYLHHASFGIGVLGVLVIVFGVLSGLVRFVRAEFFADIIDTLMKPRVQDLAVLGAIVIIRTIISYSLNAELKSERQPTPTAP